MMISQRKNIPLVRVKVFEEPWELCTLGEHIEDYVEKTTVQNQYPVLTSSQNKGIVRQEDYFANRQVTTDSNIGYFVLPRGFFTYRSRSDNGVFKFNRNDLLDKGIISYFYPVFSIVEGDSDFYLKLLNTSIKKQAMLQAEGTGQKVLSLRKFKSIKTLVPSLPEQSAIGSLFRTLDDLLAGYKDNLANYQSLKATMLFKMFPKAGQTVPEIRLDGFEGEWERNSLSDVCTINSGRDYKHLKDGDIPVYGTGGYMLSVNEKLSDEDAIGIGRKGTIDKPYLLLAPFWTVDTLFYVTCKVGYDLNYLFLIFQKVRWKKFDESTGVPSLSKKTIEKVVSKFPSLPEQQAIGDYFSNLDNLINSHQEKISQLETLKKKLLQDMFI